MNHMAAGRNAPGDIRWGSPPTLAEEPCFNALEATTPAGPRRGLSAGRGVR